MKVNGAVVVVTGRSDLLGRRVSRSLRSAGAQVLNIGPRDFDLRRPAEVRDMLRSIRPEAVVHVGGQASRAAIGYGARGLHEAVIASVELIEACRVFGVQRLLLAETQWALTDVGAETLLPHQAAGSRNTDTLEASRALQHLLTTQGILYRQQTSLDVSLLSLENLYAADTEYATKASRLVTNLVDVFTAAVAASRDDVQLWSETSPAQRLLHVEQAAQLTCDALEVGGATPPSIDRGVTLHELAGVVAEQVGFRGTIFWSADGGLSISPDGGTDPASAEVSRVREFVAWCLQSNAALPAASPLVA